MNQKFFRRMTVALPLAALAFSTMFAANGIRAYFTDTALVHENNFTMALDVSHVIVEKFPAPDEKGIAQVFPSAEDNKVRYEKAVQVINTGYVDEYVRVKIEFTDSTNMKKTKFSFDGEHFYDANPDAAAGSRYMDHLPDGWIYNEDDGFFYYTGMLEAGEWEKVEKKLVYDKEQFRYFYKDKDEIMENSMITVPLIRYVDTQFLNPKDMGSYGISVIAQSCPFYTGTDYADAWANYDPNDYL